MEGLDCPLLGDRERRDPGPAPGALTPHRTTPRHRRTTLQPAEKFLSEAGFPDYNLRGRLFGDTCPLVFLSCFQTPQQIPHDEAVRQEFRPVKVGDSFGPT
uniref:Uncharacterized protein n=1 Tax=Chelonoidis abingdonii TaxID=106734 RepID=A0A8C0GX73_CHEAB